jgi:uncharacterized protein YehS (DUF1456 family)
MAVDLTVHLTDEEQAKIVEIAAVVAPQMTPLELKAWAEKEAKNGLRETVQKIYFDYLNKSMHQAWPIEEPVPPPQTP